MSDLEQMVRAIVRDELAKVQPANDQQKLRRKIGSIFLKRGTWWARLKNEHGRWIAKPTGYHESQRDQAWRFMRDAQRQLDRLPRAAPLRPQHKPRLHRATLGTRGVIYALRLNPDAMPNRIKVGFTSSNLTRRLGQHRVTCPSLEVLAIWRGSRADEGRAHAVLSGRLGPNEIFDVANVDAALASIDGVLGARACP